MLQAQVTVFLEIFQDLSLQRCVFCEVSRP